MIGRMLEEFPDFDAAYLPPIPAGWLDMSWHNDACPCWAVHADEALGTYGDVYVFVDYFDPATREFPKAPRFSVHDMGAEHTSVLLATDDWDEVLRLVREMESK